MSYPVFSSDKFYETRKNRNCAKIHFKDQNCFFFYLNYYFYVQKKSVVKNIFWENKSIVL